MAEKNKPAARLRAFPLEAAVWRNTGKERDWFSVTLERSYKDEAGEYQKTNSLGKDDLLLAAKLLDKAHSMILNLEAADYAAKRESRAKQPATASGDAPPMEGDDVPF